MILTIEQALVWAKEQLVLSDSPALDSRLLLCHALQCEQVYLLTWPDKTLDPVILSQYQQQVAKRKTGQPVAYLLGYRDFWTQRLQVSPATLIPRPETELLVEIALGLPLTNDAQVLDLGTGTGAIALALASEKPNWRVTGVDVNPDAVLLAKVNAADNHLKHVRFLPSDWFSALDGNKFSLIVSNPPYVETGSEYLQQGDVRFEPDRALVSGEDGLDDIRLIIAQSATFLSANGWLAFEHGSTQHFAIQAILAEQGFDDIQTHCDLNQLPRITLARMPVPDLSHYSSV
ncbi:MAG: release factor glutamine methyltransferase [Paraglaciecola sp.]|jgi:release factor glutamine methyltransferase